jgi:glycosyltransferase involved in cell wall biosynthesis
VTPGASERPPDVAVVVPSHDRPAGLARLLDALAEQTLPRERFEVVVAHDSSDAETEALLRAHPLADEGVLRHLSFPPGPGPAQKRNAAWREARAPLVAFTDDDCRPESGWLEGLVAAASNHPGAIVQGATRPDPEDLHLARRAGARSQAIDPPSPHAQTCNILYPRDLLARLDGFEEGLPVAAGEDTDLAWRALDLGAEHVGAPDAVTYHAVASRSLADELAGLVRWQHLGYVVARHPRARDHLVLRVFWKPTHAWLTAALGVFALTRRPWLALLPLAGWARAALPSYGAGWRGRARAISELPLRAVVDVFELGVAIRGAIRYRTLFL